MDERLKFREALAGLLSAAGDSHMISKEKAEAILDPFALSKEQTGLVYAYLAEQKIRVEGADSLPASMSPSETIPASDGGNVSPEGILNAALEGLNPEDRAAYEEYLELIRGDAGEYEQLRKCADLAVPFAGYGIPLADLIQEANVGLILAKASIDVRAEGVSEEEFIREGIRDAVRNLLEEEEVLKDQDRRILEKVNYITDVIHNMSDDLGRKVSLEELTEKLEMDMEEVKDILKLTGETFDEDAGDSKKLADRKASPDQETYGYLDMKDFKVY